MPNSLTLPIQSLTIENASTVGNGTMLALLREQVPDLEDRRNAEIDKAAF